VNRNEVSVRDDVSGYAAIQASGRAALRRAILDAASRLLVAEGLDGLTLRRIAREVGCSTTVLYTQFGGKHGLLDALLLEGFDRLWQAEAATLAEPDPLARLAALGRAYRQNALRHPDYYRVMFGGALPGLRPSERVERRRRPTFRVLVDAVRACVEAGVLRPDDPERIALILWATVHGVVSLEISGEIGEAEGDDVFRAALRAIGAGFATGPPPGT
jgi:AcrR family transcriptional regulator